MQYDLLLFKVKKYDKKTGQENRTTNRTKDDEKTRQENTQID